MILFLLSHSTEQAVLITIGILFGMPLAVLPAQILWINIIEDSFSNMALAAKPDLFAAMLLLVPVPSHADPTTITVRVISKGAKFVGSSMGGVQITIRNALTGVVLSTGITQGSTGATDRNMKTPANRNAVLSDETSARFTAAIDISQPTWIEVRAYGPLAQIQSANTVSSTQWVIPGKHIDGGDAWLLELPGFVVDILAPPAHSTITQSPAAVAVQASVTMMCGCPIVPGGLWGI